MKLISINNVYVDKKIQWQFSFDVVEALPSVEFKIEQTDDPSQYKYVNISEIYIQNTHQVKGTLFLDNIFSNDIKDTTKVDIQKEYTIRKIIVSYNNEQDVITSEIDTDFPLEEILDSTNINSQEAQQQAIVGYVNRLGEEKKLIIYRPGFLDMPFRYSFAGREYGAEVYIAELKPHLAWKGFVEPQLETLEEINKLLIPDEDGTFNSKLNSDGQVFVVAEKKDKYLEAIQPLQMKLYRTNRAIAWIEDFNLTDNSPLEKEGLINSESYWKKRGLQFRPAPYRIMELDNVSFPGIDSYRAEHYWGELNGVYVDIENYPEKIQNEYTEIIIEDFGSKESVL